MKVDKEKTADTIDDILVQLWNDLANRQAGKEMFDRHMDILEARTALLHIIESARQGLS